MAVNSEISQVKQVQPALLNEAAAADLAAMFKALADPTRIRIISILAQTELCVGDLAAALAMSQSAVSHQLSTMRQARLVKPRKVGRIVYYALDDEHVYDLFQRGLEHVAHH